jgi:hypothetical protein
MAATRGVSFFGASHVHGTYGCVLPLSREIPSHIIPHRRSRGPLESMYAEPGHMRHSDLEVSRGDLVHDLSPEIVNEAFRLTKDGRQQLHTILEPGKTFFKFRISFDGRTVQTSILISTVVCQESGHSSSHVAARY